MELNEQNILAFMTRFDHFFDGWIHSLQFQEDQGESGDTCELIVSVRDAEAASRESKIKLLVEGVEQLRFIRDKGESLMSLSIYGFTVKWIDKRIYCCFDSDLKDYPDDLSWIDFSKFLIVGKRLSWQNV